MSQLVKTKRQASFKGFKRFGALKGLVEQKNVVFKLVRLALVPKKQTQLYTQIRQINYCFVIFCCSVLVLTS
jgi:hypothetical protein